MLEDKLITIHKKESFMTQFFAWIGRQKNHAKFAWAVVMVVATLFGYHAKLEPANNQEVMGELIYLHQEITNLNLKLATPEALVTPVKVEPKVWPIPDVK